MKSLMSKVFKSSLLGSIALVVLGILLIFQSEATIVSIAYVIGAIVISLGAIAILKFVKGMKENGNNQLDIFYGAFTIALGVIIIGNPQAIASIMPIVVGFIIIINSANKLQYSMELKNNENDLWKSTAILAIITTICGVVLVLNPFKGVVFITKIIGFLILIYAILDIISTITIRNTVKQFHNAIEERIVDADIVEEKPKKEKTKKKSKSRKNKKDENETKEEKE